MTRLLLLLSCLWTTEPVWAQSIVYEVHNDAQLQAAIASSQQHTSGTAQVAHIIVRGRITTMGIPVVSGLLLECADGTGYWKPALILAEGAERGIIYYPDEFKTGGGGQGRNYQHHTVIRGCSLNGNFRNTAPLIELYNGGFQMRIEDSHLHNSGGPCVYLGRTALNVALDNVDFSDCRGGALIADIGMLSGVLSMRSGQIDNSGSETIPTIRITQSRGSGWQGAPGIVSIRDYQFEYQQFLPPAVIEVRQEGESGLGMIYDGLSIGVAHKTWTGRKSIPALILDSSSSEYTSGHVSELPIHHDIRSVRSNGAIDYGFQKGSHRMFPKVGNTIIIGQEYIK